MSNLHRNDARSWENWDEEDELDGSTQTRDQGKRRPQSADWEKPHKSSKGRRGKRRDQRRNHPRNAESDQHTD